MPDNDAARWEAINRSVERYNANEIISGTLIKQELHPADAQQFHWKSTHGEIQSYRHVETERHIHITNDGQFVNQQKEPISKVAALDHAMGPGKHHGEVVQHKHDNGISL